MNNDLQAMFSRIARKYDFLNRLMSAGLDRHWRRKAVSLIPDRNKTRILDLCAGTGDFALEYMKKNTRCKTVLVDFSEEILHLAEKKLVHRGHSSQTALAVADVVKLPFNDRTFDAVLCGFGIRNINQPVDILLEAKRVLKKQGKFVVLEFFRPIGFLKRLFFHSFIAPLIPLLGAIFSGNFKAYRYLVRSIQENLALEEFCLLTETVGFRNVTGKRLGIGYASVVTGET